MKNEIVSRQRQFFIVALLVLMFIANLAFSQAIFSQNIGLQEVSERSAKIQSELANLKVKAAELSSYEYILSQAKDLGFDSSPEVVYLLDSGILARNE